MSFSWSEIQENITLFIQMQSFNLVQNPRQLMQLIKFMCITFYDDED